MVIFIICKCFVYKKYLLNTKFFLISLRFFMCQIVKNYILIIYEFEEIQFTLLILVTTSLTKFNKLNGARVLLQSVTKRSYHGCYVLITNNFKPFFNDFTRNDLISQNFISSPSKIISPFGDHIKYLFNHQRIRKINP